MQWLVIVYNTLVLVLMHGNSLPQNTYIMSHHTCTSESKTFSVSLLPVSSASIWLCSPDVVSAKKLI